MKQFQSHQDWVQGWFSLKIFPKGQEQTWLVNVWINDRATLVITEIPARKIVAQIHRRPNLTPTSASALTQLVARGTSVGGWQSCRSIFSTFWKIRWIRLVLYRNDVMAYRKRRGWSRRRWWWYRGAKRWDKQFSTIRRRKYCRHNVKWCKFRCR